MAKKHPYPSTAEEWVDAKYGDYEIHQKKVREREHKLFKREFINAFLAEQERRNMEECKEEDQSN